MISHTHKGDNKIDDPVVLAKKQFAEQMATASGMSYKIIKGSDVETGNYDFLLNEDSNTYVVQSQIDILQ